MKKKASELMGETVIAGSLVSPRGFTKKVATRQALGQVAGALGGAAAMALSGHGPVPAIPGNNYAPMYMAVGATKVAFFALKRGFFGNSVDRLLVEHARADVQSLGMGQGLFLRDVELSLRDGTSYQLECGNQYFGNLKKVKEALG
jgi:hypothetical protein